MSGIEDTYISLSFPISQAENTIAPRKPSSKYKFQWRKGSGEGIEVVCVYSVVSSSLGPHGL